MALAGGGAQSGTTLKKGFLIRRERAASAASAAAGERPRLPASTRAALKATSAAAVPAQDPPAGRRARPGQEEARGLAQTAAAAATAVPSFIVPDSESEEAVKECREGGVAPVKVKEPGAEINLNNLKDFF